MSGQTCSIKSFLVNPGDGYALARMAFYRLSDIAGEVNAKVKIPLTGKQSRHAYYSYPLVHSAWVANCRLSR
jgi:hypothetical protein